MRVYKVITYDITNEELCPAMVKRLFNKLEQQAEKGRFFDEESIKWAAERVNDALAQEHGEDEKDWLFEISDRRHIAEGFTSLSWEISLPDDENSKWMRIEVAKIDFRQYQIANREEVMG